MNAPVPNLPAERKPQIVAGGAIAALVPQNLEEAFRLAGAMAASGMAPRGMDRPEQVMVAILAGAEIGFAPYQAMQSFAIVNNRATLWGDAIPALLWSHGFKLTEWFDSEDEPTRAFCKVTRPDGTEIERTYSLADAKLANLLGKQGPWQTSRKRMLQMRARAFAARDGASDVLKGLGVREEVEDYTHTARVVAPAASGLRERLSGTPSEEGFNASHAADQPVDFVEHAEEIAETEFSEPEADPPAPDVNDAWDHAAWAQAQRENCDQIGNPDDVQAWWAEVAESDDYKALIAADEAEALALKAHVVRHKRGLTQAQSAAQ